MEAPDSSLKVSETSTSPCLTLERLAVKLSPAATLVVPVLPLVAPEPLTLYVPPRSALPQPLLEERLKES